MADGDNPRALRRAKARLPRRLRKDLAALDAKRAQGRFVPYRTRSEVQKAEDLSVSIAQHLDQSTQKKERGRRLRGWFGNLMLNYIYFAAALAGFWYVATQI